MKFLTAAVFAGGALLVAGQAAADGKTVYTQTCAVCHATGTAGAPKLGDKAAWGPRLGGGSGALLNSVLKGKGAMPPKGGNASLTDSDVKQAMEYMVSTVK